jgi:hypothetical protein
MTFRYDAPPMELLRIMVGPILSESQSLGLVVAG